MIVVFFKVINEIDWILFFKLYIQNIYGDDLECYVEECVVINWLCQDMCGVGKDSIVGRDLLYWYYGQLEFLDFCFLVDEQYIKIFFIW